MLARLLRFIERARRKHPGQAVIAVTHGDPIRFLMGWAMGYSVDTEFNNMKYPETGSVVALTYSNGQDRPNLKMFTPLASKPL
jgi:broad specificity phosphatase PhoE